MPYPLKSKIDEELKTASEALREGNDGKARACSRRAAGIAIAAWENSLGRSEIRSAVDRLRAVATSDQFPEPVRKAARRLVTNVNDRLSVDFTMHPVNDAKILIDHFSSNTSLGGPF